MICDRIVYLSIILVKISEMTPIQSLNLYYLDC